MRKWKYGVSVLALVVAGNAGAQEAVGGSGDVTTLERIVVTTPLRRESELARATSSVTVIDEGDIARSAASDLPSLLKTVAGISVRTNGGLGSASTISLRGASSEQTLVLVNGVRTSSATSGATAVSNIPLVSIERIEIAKGAHSAQYGADAIGGVVNIITKKGGACADGRDMCGSLTTGVTHPWGGHLSANIAGVTPDGLNYAFGGGLIGTRGYDFTTQPVELDDDGFLQGSLNFSLSKIYGWGELYADGLYSRGRNQYDNAWGGADESDTDAFAGRIGAKVRHSETWSSRFELTSSFDYSSNFRGAVDGDDFNTLRHGLLASTEKVFELENSRHILVGGIEAYRDEVDSSLAYAVDKRDLAAVFAQHSWEYGALTIDSGIRYDHNEQFGNATTYNLGAAYEIVPELTVRASFATGFRAPTFNELYYPFSGNPNLRPETSESYEVGFIWRPTDSTSFDVALYHTRVEDQINWAPVDPSNPGGFWLPFNTARVEVTGLEATLNHRFDERWSGWTSIDLRAAKNRDTGLYVPYQDRFKAAVGLAFAATERLDLGAEVLYAASRYSNEANTAKIPHYFVVDFTGNYRLDEQSDLKLSVGNVFDEDYSTSSGYRSPGRTVELSFTRAF